METPVTLNKSLAVRGLVLEPVDFSKEEDMIIVVEGLIRVYDEQVSIQKRCAEDAKLQEDQLHNRDREIVVWVGRSLLIEGAITSRNRNSQPGTFASKMTYSSTSLSLQSSNTSITQLRTEISRLKSTLTHLRTQSIHDIKKRDNQIMRLQERALDNRKRIATLTVANRTPATSEAIRTITEDSDAYISSQLEDITKEHREFWEIMKSCLSKLTYLTGGDPTGDPMAYVPHEPERLEYLINGKLDSIRDILSQLKEKPDETIKSLEMRLDELVRDNEKLKKDLKTMADRYITRQPSAVRDVSQMLPQSPRTPMEKRVMEVKKSGIPKFISKERVQRPLLAENVPERDESQKELEEVLGILPKNAPT